MSNNYYFRSYLAKYLINLWGNRMINQVDIKFISKNITKQVTDKHFVFLRGKK